MCKNDKRSAGFYVFPNKNGPIIQKVWQTKKPSGVCGKSKLQLCVLRLCHIQNGLKFGHNQLRKGEVVWISHIRGSAIFIFFSLCSIQYFYLKFSFIWSLSVLFGCESVYKLNELKVEWHIQLFRMQLAIAELPWLYILLRIVGLHGGRGVKMASKNGFYIF